MIWRFVGALVLGLGISSGSFAETLTVGGTGSSGPLVQKLFDDFAKRHPGNTLNLISPPLGSSGGIKAAMVGRVDMAFTGRAPKPEEAAKLGSSFALAETPFVLVSNDASGTGNLTVDQLADIYVGKNVRWPSGRPVRLILRAKNDSDTDMLRSMSAAMNNAVPAANDRPGMTVAADDLETLDLLQRTPSSFGPTTLGLLRCLGSSLAPVPVNGVTPSVSTLKNGSYPWRKVLSVVLPATPTRLAQQFADYLRSGDADVILGRYDYLRVK